MINLLKNIRENFYIGIRSYPVSKEWDEILNMYMDKFEVKLVSECRVTFSNGVEVWIANRFYAFGRPYSPHVINVLPKIKTARRLWNLIKDKVPSDGRIKEQLSELKDYGNPDK